MAIWQFRINLIPKSALLGKFGTWPDTVPEVVAEYFPWWANYHLHEGFDGFIGLMLPDRDSWSNDIRMWGVKHGDTAEICFADEHKTTITQISFRVDVRDISLAFVHGICVLAKRLDCILMTAEHRLLPPDESELLAVINESTSRKFVQDPESTLSNAQWLTADSIHQETEESLEYELLRRFFGAYFNEGWDFDGRSDEEVVALYKKATAPEQQVELSKAIVSYLQRHSSNMKLEDDLCRDLVCGYRPTDNGMTIRDWLLHVASLASPSGSKILPYSRVKLTTDKYENEGASSGMLGYVIESYDDGMYEVEFSNASGITIAQLVVSEEDLALEPETK